MEILGKGYEFLFNLRFSSLMLPYIRQELDRKYNTFSKVRLLKETDCDLAVNLEGKVCVITGGTRGIGLEVVKVLLKKECHVIVGSSSNNADKNQQIYDSIRAEVPEGKGKLEIWHMDLKSMDSVVAFAEKFKETKLPINYLVANAGISDPVVKMTRDQFEEHFAINYLSHCLLIDRLSDNLLESAKTSNSESRIVLVSSCVHRGQTIKFNDLMCEKSTNMYLFAYCQSKLAMIMFGIRMNRWMQEKGMEWCNRVTINSLHPGICNTQLFANMPLMSELRPLAALAVRSAKEGAENIIYATLSRELNGVSGKYLEECAVEEPSKYSQDKEEQDRLWDTTWKLLAKWTLHPKCYWI